MLLNVKEDGYTRSEFKDFVNKVEAVARGNNLKLLDMNDELSPLTIATQVLSFFSIFTTVVAMSICFFSLMSSMYSNINEQAKEIGILRAIGARKWTIVRIFIYESFILIIAASLMGIIIGFTIGYTMALQNTLFTELPLDLIIPWQIILEIFLLAVVFSFISSLGPILNLLRLPIVVILRRIIG
jgi:ABC-type antimicrobial peptide transport system permease subunit